MRINNKKLRHIMEMNGLYQSELAKLSNVNRASINNICCGRSCAPETARKIARALRVPLEDLVEEDDA